MKRLTIFTTALLSAATLFAEPPTGPSPESRLREQIKSLMTQARTAEAAQAALAVEKAALDEKVKAFQKQAEEDAKARAAEKETATKELEALKADLATKEKQLAEEMALKVKADEFGKKADEFGKKTEAERAKLAGEAESLKRTVASQRVKNAKMYEITTELLDRYSKFGLGKALTAREPFVGVTRARLETMVEELGSAAADQRIRLDGTSPKPSDAKPTEKKPAVSKP